MYHRIEGHLHFAGWLSEQCVLSALIRLVHIYPTIWWRRGTPSDGGRGSFSDRFSCSGDDWCSLTLTQTLTHTTPGADGSIGAEIFGKQPCL